MPVKSFECAIARSQINRYLAGEALAPEAMESLEKHIAQCDDCQRLVDLRRVELLEGPKPETLAVSTPDAQAIAEAVSGDLPLSPVAAAAAFSTSGASTARKLTPEQIAAAWQEEEEVRAPRPNPYANTVDLPTIAAAATNEVPLKLEITPDAAPAKKGFKLGLPKLYRVVPDETTEAATIESVADNAIELNLPNVDKKGKVKPARPTKEPKATQAVGDAAPKQAAAKKKVAIYGVGLIATLGVMAAMGDPTMLLGGKAAAAEPGAKLKEAQAKLSTEKPTRAKLAEGGNASQAPKDTKVATNVSRSVMGMPITNAVPGSTGGEATKPSAKANANEEMDAALNDALSSEAPKPTAADVHAAAKPSTSKPKLVMGTALQSSAKADKAAVPTKTLATKPGAVKPGAAKPNAAKIGAKPTAIKSSLVAKAPVAHVSTPKSAARLGAVKRIVSLKTASAKSAMVKSGTGKAGTAKVGTPKVAATKSIVKKSVASSVAPKKVAPKKVVAKRAPAPKKGSAAKKSAGNDTIRIYDESGKPVN